MGLYPASGDAADRDSCDSYRNRVERMDVTSPQSYKAQINLQRTLHEVNELTLQTQRQESRLILYYILGGLLLLGAVVASVINLRRKNRYLRQSEKELEEAQCKARLSIQTKNLFLSNMSHEIRTPLNALSGFSAILTDSHLDAAMRQQCNDIILQNSELLVKLIDDVVDLSNLEKGRMAVSCTPCDVVDLCRKLVDTVDRIKQTPAEVRILSPLDQLTLHTDPARLQQLLFNLLINATKFTTEGSITLSLEVKDGEALFAVTDTGCGIAPEQQAVVFNRFEKLHEDVQGTGLGLSICQLIVNRLGGRIWIDSDYHQGARFCFTHPLPPVEETATGKEAGL